MQPGLIPLIVILLPLALLFIGAVLLKTTELTARKVDVILRSSPAVARRTMDLFEDMEWRNRD